MFIQNLDVVPKYRDRRRAVSAVMPRFSLTMSLMRVAGTRSAKANSCADMARGEDRGGFLPDEWVEADSC
jgi:hypothetical protein